MGKKVTVTRESGTVLHSDAQPETAFGKKRASLAAWEGRVREKLGVTA